MRDLSDETVEDLVRAMDEDPLTASELEAYSDELEVALGERTAEDALFDLQSYLEATPAESARGRALQSALDTLQDVVSAARVVVTSEPDSLFEGTLEGLRTALGR